jgi:hypothetical protein
LALSSRNDPSRRSLNIIGCSGSGPVRADPAFGNGGYGDGGYGDAGYGDGTPHPGADPPGGPHAGGPHAGGDPPGPVPDPPDGWSGGSQGGGELLTSFLSSPPLGRIVTRPIGPVNGARTSVEKVDTPLFGVDVTSLADCRCWEGGGFA